MKFDNRNDHFFRGLDILKNVKFQKEPTLREFETAVRKDVGNRARVDASYVTMGKTAIYKAQVILDGRPWLYLLFPQSILADKFYVIGKKPTSNENEADMYDSIDYRIQSEKEQRHFNNPFEALKALKGTRS